MKKEVVKETPKRELNKDQKIIRGWISAFVAVILIAGIITGSVFLRANSIANKNDIYNTKEEAQEKAEFFLLQRSTYKNQEFDIKVKKKLEFHVNDMKKAQHNYYVTFKNDTITAVVKVDGVTRSAKLVESTAEKIY